MAKARVLAPERAPGDPAPEPELVKKPNRKKNRKKRFWKNKAREAGRKQGNGPGVVVVRPPKAPEDFSQNWKALQEEVRSRGPRGWKNGEGLVGSKGAQIGVNAVDRAVRREVACCGRRRARRPVNGRDLM